jgi:hypothetical protein
VTVTDPATGRVLRFEPGGEPLIVSERLAKQLAAVKHTRPAFSALPFDVDAHRFLVAADQGGWDA